MKKKVEEEELLVYIPKDLKTEMRLLVAREGSSLKALTIDCITEHIKVHKPGNPQHLITSSMENDDFIGFPSMAVSYEAKKTYATKFLQKDGRLNTLGKELWGHILQWQSELQKL